MDETAQGGRYRRVRSLGRGAMGEVWLAEDTLLHRHVALKTVASYGPPDPADLDRIMREARLAARLNHPNAVAIYDVYVENGQPCVVMEYASGMSLAERIAEFGRLPTDEVGRIGMALADALGEAHRLGIVHRDVKPANILITDRGVPKLADFGIARGIDSATTATGLSIGTPAYLAPELARGAPADTRSDVWSLGVTLYAALDGRSPFAQPGDDPLTVIGRLAMTPQVAPPQHGGTLSRTVMSAMAVDPAARPSADAIAGMLRADVSGLDATNQWAITPPPSTGSSEWTVPQQTPVRQKRRGRGGPVLAGLAVLVVVVGAGTAGWLLLRSNSSTPSAQQTSSTPPVITTPAGPSPTQTQSQQAFPGVAYTGPGGVQVTAPKGWHLDTSAGIANISDYVAPRQDRDHGTYFRIGIGNPRPEPTIRREARSAIDFLKSPRNAYTDVHVVDVKYLTFLGSDAVDIEYVGTNSAHVARHVRERLWISGGVTREISVNAPAGRWHRRMRLFDRLVGSATIS
jgi:serine/threonine protein kinase